MNENEKEITTEEIAETVEACCDCGCEHENCCGSTCDCKSRNSGETSGVELKFNLISGKTLTADGSGIDVHGLFDNRSDMKKNKESVIAMLHDLMCMDPDSDEAMETARNIITQLSDHAECLGFSMSYEGMREFTVYEEAIMCCVDYISAITSLMDYVYERTIGDLSSGVNDLMSVMFNDPHQFSGLIDNSGEDADEDDEEEYNISD